MVTEYFFRVRLDQMIGLRLALAMLGWRMPRSEFGAALALAFMHSDRKGQLVEGVVMFRPKGAMAGAAVSNAGWPDFRFA